LPEVKMNNPLVSVIIPNYNYGRYLREAIDSVLNQTYLNLEIIVVDDGSKDNSKEVLESYGTRIKTIFQQNQGVSAARNNGVALSRGEYLAFLDADDLWLPRKLERQLELFSRDQEIGLVHVGMEEIDEDGNTLSNLEDGMEGWISVEMLLFNKPTIFGAGSGILIPRRVFDEIGGFDPRLSTSADWDANYQISARYRIGFVREILIKYRMHKTNMHSNVRVMEDDMLLAYEKAFSGTDGRLARIKRPAYGNMYRVVAGSYFRAAQYRNFARVAVKSLFYRPGNMIYFVKYPMRFLERQILKGRLSPKL
jgi:glycosyltransferase involved in cell wall biosynthesis